MRLLSSNWLLESVKNLAIFLPPNFVIYIFIDSASQEQFDQGAVDQFVFWGISVFPLFVREIAFFR